MKFKKGQRAYTKAIGYGLVSYECAEVEAVRKGKVKLQDLDQLFDAETGKGYGDPSGLGLEIKLVVTDADLKRAQKETAEDGCN